VYRGCQFSFTVTRRLQSCILSRPREKQVGLNSIAGYILLQPRLLFIFTSPSMVPTPLVAPSKRWICDRSLAGIAGSNSARGGGAWMSVFCECFRVRRVFFIGLTARPDESYWVWCVWVGSWCPGPLGAVAPWKKISQLVKTAVPRCRNHTWSAWMT
jgi:hypothetical protein